jgi:ATP-dependent DNA helicase RecQ
VPQFARKVTAKLTLPFREVITKVRHNALQKLQNNSYHQCRNLDGVFNVIDQQILPTPVLLIDDVVDSGWTLTVAGALLRRASCTKVYPMALATTAGGG